MIFRAPTVASTAATSVRIMPVTSSDMPSAVVIDVLDLTVYQSGAIVSRTLLKRPGGTITLFAFDTGQALSEHTAPFDALVQVLDGEADVNIAGTPMRVRSGQAVLLPANQPHAVSAPLRFKMLLTMMRSSGAAAQP
jgi:quercetin dioxygenase-like cupin family protein